MRVVVAGVAIFERHIGKFLKLFAAPHFRFVAFDARHVFVFSNERKIRFVVVEFRGRFEILGRVAFRAIIAECFLMAVLVAVEAILLEPEKGFFPFFQFGVVDEIGFVAASAVNFLTFSCPAGFVSAGQFVAGQVVVKCVFIKTHHVKFPPVVVAVAFRTVLSAHFFRGMKPRVFVHPRFDLLMAFEAFRVRNLVTQVMAFGAVRESFQILVGIRQVAGRQLRRSPPHKKDEAKKDFQEVPCQNCHAVKLPRLPYF